jgi:hypothetical protein
MRLYHRVRAGQGGSRIVAALGCAALLATSALPARAAPGPEAACKALAARVEQAVSLKKQGQSAEKALAELSALPIDRAVPSGDQAAYYRKQLPSAVRFAYVAGMSPESASAYYLKQCRIGA